mmetsp:Transcript_10527/g.64591  ORF Transcript_10527/g.64591 Transcript_10527/m.64591 type:complete len:366 (+) Transcript_10527:1608-2705(+)
MREEIQSSISFLCCLGMVCQARCCAGGSPSKSKGWNLSRSAGTPSFSVASWRFLLLLFFKATHKDAYSLRNWVGSFTYSPWSRKTNWAPPFASFLTSRFPAWGSQCTVPPANIILPYAFASKRDTSLSLTPFAFMEVRSSILQPSTYSMTMTLADDKSSKTSGTCMPLAPFMIPCSALAFACSSRKSSSCLQDSLKSSSSHLRSSLGSMHRDMAWMVSSRNRSAMNCFLIWGYCTLTATHLPSINCALCTWAMLAAAIGVSSICWKARWRVGFPMSCSSTCCTAAYGFGTALSCICCSFFPYTSGNPTLLLAATNCAIFAYKPPFFWASCNRRSACLTCMSAYVAHHTSPPHVLPPASACFHVLR